MHTKIIRMVSLSKVTKSSGCFIHLEYRILWVKQNDKYCVRRVLNKNGLLDKTFSTICLDYVNAQLFFNAYVGELCLNGYHL